VRREGGGGERGGGGSEEGDVWLGGKVKRRERERIMKYSRRKKRSG